MSKQIENPIMKYGMAIVFSAIGVSGSVVSMVRVEPSGWLITVTIAAFFCMLAVLFSDRIESFSLRDLTAKLRAIESKVEAAKDIAEDAAGLAIEVADAARESGSYYGGSSSGDDENWDSSSGEESWDSVDEKAALLRKKLQVKHGVGHNGS